MYCIRPHNLNCASKNVVYFFTCKTCHKQYTGSTKEFRSRFNNYSCSHMNFLRNKKVKQVSFHALLWEWIYRIAWTHTNLTFMFIFNRKKSFYSVDNLSFKLYIIPSFYILRFILLFLQVLYHFNTLPFISFVHLLQTYC